MDLMPFCIISLLLIDLSVERCEEKFHVIKLDHEEEYYDSNYRMRYRTEKNSSKMYCVNIFSNSEPLVFPSEPFRDIPFSVDIQNSSIEKLQPSFFLHLPVTTKFFLQGINIKKISPGAFNGQNNISELYLDKNKLEEISEGQFNSLHALKILSASKNNIQVVSDESFMGMKQLEELHLEENHITFLDEILFETQVNLTFLNLSSNYLPNINRTFSNLSLKVLDLSHNKIASLEIKPFSNPKLFCNSLKELFLGHNLISEINSDIFSNLYNLTNLDLKSNNLSDIPNTCFKNLKSLEILDLSYNNIAELEYGLFDNLIHLKYLNISNNMLTILQLRPFLFLRELLEFNFENNQISNIDIKQLIFYLPKLKYISLKDNTWNCNKLETIIYSLISKDMNVKYGNSYSDSNIRGIKCSQNDLALDLNQNFSPSEVKSEAKNFDVSKDFVNTFMYNFFNTGFQKSNFYKYLESFNQNLNSVKNEKALEVNNETKFHSSLLKYFEKLLSNNSLNNYLHKDFEKSNFFKYLEGLQSIKNIQNKEDFSKSSMANYFNKDFENTKFYKYLENLKNPKFYITASYGINESKAEKLVNSMDVADNFNNKGEGILTVDIFLLIAVLGLLIVISYVIFFNKKRNIPNEHIGLVNNGASDV